LDKKIPESERSGYTNNTIKELMKGFLTTSRVMILKNQSALMLARWGQDLYQQRTDWEGDSFT